MGKIKLYENPDISSKFVASVTAAPSHEIDQISDRLSSALSRELGLGRYSAICDIVKSRSPSDIFMRSEGDAGDPVNLREKSDIIKAIKARTTMRIYVDPDPAEAQPKDLLMDKITTVIDEETGA